MKKKASSFQPSILFRLFFFSILFVFVSGLMGSQIIGTNLLYGFGFFIYGNFGKIILFGCVASGILIWRKKQTLSPLPYSCKYLWYIIAGFLLIPIFFILSQVALPYHSFTDNIVLAISLHSILIAIPILFGIGIFTPSFIGIFFRTYWKLICVGSIAGIFYDFSIFYIWQLWPLLSNIVLIIMKMTFSLTQHPVYVIPPRSLFVHNFSITIAEACSGIDSMYLLITLYLLMVCIDWHTLNKQKIILYFIPLFLGMFVVNIIRVYILIYLGVLFNPEVSVTLFHTYLGLVLFLIYFFGFLYFFYPAIHNKRER